MDQFKDNQIEVVQDLKKVVDALTPEERQFIGYDEKEFDCAEYQRGSWGSLNALEETAKRELKSIPKRLKKYHRMQEIKKKNLSMTDLLERIQHLPHIWRIYLFGYLDMKELTTCDENQVMIKLFYKMGKISGENSDVTGDDEYEHMKFLNKIDKCVSEIEKVFN
jgi:hypothetical protein